jgi:hypothetical protein
LLDAGLFILKSDWIFFVKGFANGGKKTGHQTIFIYYITNGVLDEFCL